MGYVFRATRGTIVFSYARVLSTMNYRNYARYQRNLNNGITSFKDDDGDDCRTKAGRISNALRSRNSSYYSKVIWDRQGSRERRPTSLVGVAMVVFTYNPRSIVFTRRSSRAWGYKGHLQSGNNVDNANDTRFCRGGGRSIRGGVRATKRSRGVG